ncbi:MAG TPA: hypothetical protein VKX96_03785 [Chloroflexota bacterium]|nr:hypothetical protein [Chloroflexota bacterium]
MTPISDLLTIPISRDELVDRIVEHSRLADWNGNWAIQYNPMTGQHDWCWIGRFPPMGTNPEREPRPGWKVLILPRINANKLTVDARKDRIEDPIWRASAEGTLDGWLEAGEPLRAGVKLKFI